MRVFRLETDIGTGVFECGAANHYNNLDLEHSPFDHPSPTDEGLRLSRIWYCGFVDENQMQTWFPKIDELHHVFDSAGVKWAIYEVDVNLVSVGKHQVTFLRNTPPIIRVPVRERHNAA